MAFRAHFWLKQILCQNESKYHEDKSPQRAHGRDGADTAQPLFREEGRTLPVPAPGKQKDGRLRSVLASEEAERNSG